jgi:hypothetical protein
VNHAKHINKKKKKGGKKARTVVEEAQAKRGKSGE